MKLTKGRILPAPPLDRKPGALGTPRLRGSSGEKHLDLRLSPFGRCCRVNAAFRARRWYRQNGGYLMVEALVYIAVVFALLGVGYSAVYRCLDRSLALRRNADDITAALHAGERWRGDVRDAGTRITYETNDPASTFHLATSRGDIAYRFEENSIFRRVGSNQWVRLLPNVKWSAMQSEQRKSVMTCRWDFELLPYKRDTSNTNRVHPLFSFVAVPQGTSR